MVVFICLISIIFTNHHLSRKPRLVFMDGSLGFEYDTCQVGTSGVELRTEESQSESKTFQLS